MTRSYSGCDRCGYVGRTGETGDERTDCPRCGAALREIGLPQARALARGRRRERDFNRRVQDQLSELAKDRSYDERIRPSPSSRGAGSSG